MKRLLLFALLVALCSPVAIAGRWESFHIEIKKELDWQEDCTASVYCDAGSSASRCWAETSSNSNPPGQTGYEEGWASAKAEAMIGYWWIPDGPYDPPTNVRMYYTATAHHFNQAGGSATPEQGYWDLWSKGTTSVAVPPFSSSNRVEGYADSNAGSHDADASRSCSYGSWDPSKTYVVEDSAVHGYLASDTRKFIGSGEYWKDSNGANAVYIVVRAQAFSDSQAEYVFAPDGSTVAGNNCSISITKRLEQLP